MEKQINNKYNISSTVKLHTGNQIPIIGYGTYQLFKDQCRQGVIFALNAGYTHIDTASIYRNQIEIRDSLKKSGVQRKKLYITSKIAPTQQGLKEARQACLTIIQKLGCQYLDLILIHWPGVSKIKVDSPKNAQIRLQTWKALIQLKKQGKVKDIGVSNFLKHHLQHLLKNSQQKPVINQIQIHPLLWQEETIKYCQENKIEIQAYSPLARSSPKLFENKLLIQLSQKYHKSVAQISLRFLMQMGFIILPKSKSKNRIQQNINIFDFEISKQDLIKIQELKKQNLRTCWNPQMVVY